MAIMMKYGKSGLAIDLPDDLNVEVIRKPVMPVLTDPEGALRFALSHPAGSRSLPDEARGCTSACILICDITRPVPNGVILPLLIRTLLEAGIEPSAITVLIATGLHRPNEGDECREVVGSDWVMETVTVANHFARLDEDHEEIGMLNGIIPIKLDRRFLHADLRIVLGLVEPHLMAGYSGGRKIISPGICHEDTIRRLHAAAVLEDCGTTFCNMEDNPLHQLQMDILRLTGRCQAVNTVIDEDRRLSFVNFGDIEASHLEAVSFVRPYAEIPLPRRFRTVLTSAAGYPLDKTYYQVIKGMVGPLDILEPGGDLIVVAECSEGLGSEEFVDAQQRLIRQGPEGFLRELLQKPVATIDEWQTEMLVKALNKGNVYLYSEGLTAEEMALTGVRPVSSVVEAVLESRKRQGADQVAVIPEGPYVIPLWHENTSKL